MGFDPRSRELMSRFYITLLGALILVCLVSCGDNATQTTFAPAGSLNGSAGSAAGSSSGSAAGATPAPSNSPSIGWGIFQNPFLAPNPTNNIHNDSYLTDSYANSGPVSASGGNVAQLSTVAFTNPFTGQPLVLVLGECGAIAYDGAGNVITVSAGLPDLITHVSRRDVLAIDPNTLKILAWTSFTSTVATLQSALTDFGGAGYFFEDNQHRVVVALANGHIEVLVRQKSPVSDVDQFVAAEDFNVTGDGGAVPVPNGQTALTLYALMPDKSGNIWFTTVEGVVGTISPSGVIKWLDLNDPNGTGTPQPQPDGGLQEIANSHAVDEGDSSSSPSGVYVVTTYQQYRLQAGPDGTPQIAWQMAYDRGTAQKPGQVSFGSGTSPTIFRMNGRRFVAICDNAQFMHVNVYRAEAQLQTGEQRLFAQLAPFGSNTLVSDENSVVVGPDADNTSVDIFAENNYGYTGFSATDGSGVTQPGFACLRITPDGGLTVASLNSTIAIPTIVTKLSIPAHSIYTYEKRTSGWYLTGLSSDDVSVPRFSVFVGPGQDRYDNHYSGLSLAPDGRTFFFGTAVGLTRVIVNP